MTNILIPTKPDDTHAIFTKLALEKIGHRADLWYTADFPSQQTHSFSIVHDEIIWRAKGLSMAMNDCKYDIVWYRRPTKPVLPVILHPDDKENANKENAMFAQTIWHAILPNAIWINPVAAVTRVNSKLLQLQRAAKLGLKIPDTLISNDPEHIKQFIQQHEKRTIYKTLYPMTWLNKDEVRLTYTNLIELKDLPKDVVLQSTPGIFQEKIDKQYELRVTYFGDQPIAVKIYSQQHEQAKMDWRSAPTKELQLEVVTLPEKINRACIHWMKNFNIQFGCFDFIVTPDNEYYFLEMNEQGQFLWIEETNPEIPMLQSFVEFLLHCSGKENKKLSPLFLQDFEKEVMQIREQAIKNHIEPLL